MSEPFPVLVSYAYLRECKDSFINWLFSRPELRMLLDSGAFTALNKGEAINVQDYINFLQRWKHRIHRYAALDVINNPKDTRENLFKMLEAGLKPIPVFVTGEPQEWLEELYKHSDVVAIPLSLPVSKSMSVRRKFMTVRMAWAAGRRVHWFGFTEQRSIEKWMPYSCDSTGWLSGGLFGQLRLYKGQGRWLRSVKYHQYMRDGRLRAQVDQVVIQNGFPDGILRDQRYWHGNIHNEIPYSWHVCYQLAIESMVRYVREIRKVHQTWHYLSAGITSGDTAFDSFQARPGARHSDLYWLYQHIMGIQVARIKEVSDESSSARVGGAGQHSASSPSSEGEARGGIRIVSRLRPAARAGTQFRQEGLLDVGDSD